MTKDELKKKAGEIRYLCAEAFLKAGMGHLGGAFSMADCMSVLFFQYIREKPKDWFVLSKGHAGPSYYAALAIKGKISKDDLYTLNQPGTNVPSHPDRHRTNGVDCSTGSLGQGLSQAVGIAYGLKCQNKAGNVYCMIGDGECNEGEIWEAFEFAGNKKLNNLIIIVDNNKRQVDGYTSEVSCSFDFEKIAGLFGFVFEHVDGNDIEQLDNAFRRMADNKSGSTRFLIMDTIKGSGVPEIADTDACHHIRVDEKMRQILEKNMRKWKREIADEQG